ncbi:hypothetical protein OH491_27990 (plasmid) [Termitidicoccus mucosus]|uniref:hypothetical protein n=1 Tax=Termitidicoccus mucosus TaxID=1184151 RepID=UPI00318354F8
MNRHPPNGYFINDFIVWGAFKKCDHHERFCDNPPDLRGAGDAAAAKCHEDIVKYLQSIALNIRVQFQWCCNADYSKALDAYGRPPRRQKIPLKKSQGQPPVISGECSGEAASPGASGFVRLATD